MSAGRRRRRANESADRPKGRPVRGPSLVSGQSPPSDSPLPTARSVLAGRAVWVSLTLILVNMVIYAPVPHHDFVNYDDPEYVSENPHVSGGLTRQALLWAFTTKGHGANWHPLTSLSHMLDVELYGLNAGGHHLNNLILHIVNTVLLFGVLRMMTGALGRSAFVAALFAAHPLHVESVAWVSERKDVLSTLFWMLTLWGYVWYVRRPGRDRYLAVVLLFAMGLMAKPMLVTLPFVLLLLDVWPLGRVSLGVAPDPRLVRRLVWEKLPLLALAVVLSIVTFMVQQQQGAVSGLDALPLNLRVQNALVSYVAYIGKMLWPARLAAFYPYPQLIPGWWVGGAILGLIGVSVAVIRKAWRYPYLPVGWLWYLGTLVPVIGLVQVGNQSMADRYTYIPLIGLFLMVAWGIPDLLPRWRYRSIALGTTAGLVISMCVIVARGQVQHWGNGVVLWTHALEVTTENYRAHAALGALLEDQGRVNEAIAHLSEAVRIRPDYAEVQNKLGAALADQGRVEEAIPHYFQALRFKPGIAEAHNNLGNALSGQGKVAEAIAHYTEALRINPDYALAHNGLGSALDEQGKVAEAIAHYREALRIEPNLAEAHNNLGAALASQGKADEAIQEFLEALRIKPDQANVHYNVAVMLDRKGETTEAVYHLQTALQLNPGNLEARRMLDDLTSRAKRSGLGTR